MTTAKIRPGRDKTNVWVTQEKKVFAALYSRPQTRLMVSKTTGVPLQNICRYIHNFRKSHTVYVVKVDRCPISEMKAEFLSTDPKYAPTAQTKIMFE